MRKIQLFIVALMGFGLAATAQDAKSVKTENVAINTPSIQCGMCKDRIEENIGALDGVTAVDVHVKKKTTTVSWDPTRINLEDIKAAIVRTGYDVDETPADQAAYMKLPKCCKKKEKKD